LVTNLRIGDHT